MTTYAMQVELTCPHCGHPGLQPVATSRPQPRLITSILRCGGCHQEQAIRVELIPVHDEPAICGSDAGYQRHRRIKEPSCQPCRDAHTRDMAGRRNHQHNQQPKEPLNT